MARPSRRGFLAGATAMPIAAAASERGADTSRTIAADLATYIGFGNKRSGGAGDNDCGHWLADELGRAGFEVDKPAISVPWFDTSGCTIVAGSARVPLAPQPIVIPAHNVSGPLMRIDAHGSADAPLSGAIALIDLSYSRWSSALAKPVRGPVDAAFEAGAKAAVIITNGPTGQIIALNADGRAPMFAGPVGLLAPADAAPFLDAAMRHDLATVTLSGRGGRRPAFNVIGRIDRGKGRWITVSTPRSGWTIAPASAAAGSRRGSNSRAKRQSCFPITTSPSCATAGMNMKIWAPKRP